jgi:hypothetical protein
MRGVAQMLFLSCQKAGMYIEKRQAGALTLTDRFQLKLHLALCDVCKLYSDQSALIDALLLKQKMGQQLGEEELEVLRKTILERHTG